MKENINNQLDELSRKVMRQSKLEQPSVDFTQNVMSKINAMKASDVTTYVPLISKPIWIMIAILFLAITSLAFFGTFNDSSSWLNRLYLDRLSEYTLPNPLINVEFSQTLFYALLLLAIMICVQVPILKRYFDKRLEI